MITIEFQGEHYGYFITKRSAGAFIEKKGWQKVGENRYGLFRPGFPTLFVDVKKVGEIKDPNSLPASK